MGVIIEKIMAVYPEYSEVHLNFAGETLHTIIYGTAELLNISINDKLSIPVEVLFKDLLTHRMLKDFKDEDSGIRQDGEYFICRGKIRYAFMLENNCIMDIFLTNGQLYISFMLTDLKGENPNIEEGIEITLTGLEFYSWTT